MYHYIKTAYYKARYMYNFISYKMIILQINDRYQIFLGGNLTDKFLNIGDGSGVGENHRELVGGLEANAVLPGTYGSAPALTGKLCLSQTEEIAYIFMVGY